MPRNSSGARRGGDYLEWQHDSQHASPANAGSTKQGRSRGKERWPGRENKNEQLVQGSGPTQGKKLGKAVSLKVRRARHQNSSLSMQGPVESTVRVTNREDYAGTEGNHRKLGNRAGSEEARNHWQQSLSMIGGRSPKSSGGEKPSNRTANRRKTDRSKPPVDGPPVENCPQAGKLFGVKVVRYQTGNRARRSRKGP